MTRKMYDGIKAADLPDDAELVAGYVDGMWADFYQLVARFPTLRHVSIAVTTAGVADVLDVETGNATPPQSVDWVLDMRAQGKDPTVYMSAAVWANVGSAFKARGVPEPHYWVASYDGKAVIPAGAIAKQYANHPGYDVSIVADYWPGVDPAPIPTEVQSVYLASVTPDPTGGKGAGIFTVDGSAITHVDEPSLGPLKTRFGDPIVVSPQYFKNLMAGVTITTDETGATVVTPNGYVPAPAVDEGQADAPEAAPAPDPAP